MIAPPETLRVSHKRNACDGATDIPGGAALGHPRVFLEIDESGYVDCGYCDRRFILIGGPADVRINRRCMITGMARVDEARSRPLAAGIACRRPRF